MRSITKEFPGVKALDNVNLVVEEGEIHALIGENGLVRLGAANAAGNSRGAAMRRYGLS